MTIPVACARVLLIGSDLARTEFRSLMPESSWEIAEASGVEQACFVQANQPCELVLLDGGLADRGWSESIAWLVGQIRTPIVLLSDVEPTVVSEAMSRGVLWLPLNVARAHPELLISILGQALRRGDERRRFLQTTSQLRDAHGRIDRLLGLLWEAAPGDGPTRWFSQRHMLERLDEEVSRLKRRGGELSLVIGELRPSRGEKIAPEDSQKLSGWVAMRLAEHKRRCDVAGRYGLDGFMLLLPRASSHEAVGACHRLGKILIRHEQHDLPQVHVRFGHASAPGEAVSVQSLLRKAEERLDEAREAG